MSPQSQGSFELQPLARQGLYNSSYKDYKKREAKAKENTPPYRGGERALQQTSRQQTKSATASSTPRLLRGRQAEHLHTQHLTARVLKTRSPHTTPRQHTTHRVLTHTGRPSGKPSHSHSPRPSPKNIRRQNSRGLANRRGTLYNNEYKQGKQVTKPQSRTTTYELLARILQQRLAAALDQHLRSTQYGFRMGRSTSQPVHIIRRLLERAERGDHSLYLLLLDWKQAFDKVSVEALQVALKRYGVPEGVLNLVTNVYTSQLFQVKAAGQTSEILQAKSGIIQGCPFSPYLFLIVHRMILFDVDKQLLEDGGLLPWVSSQQTPFYDPAYADDMALIDTAAHSNLQLNWSKSLLLESPSSQNHVYNQHVETVKEVEHAKYLGDILSRNGSSKKDVTERLHKARKHFSTLHHF